VNAACFCLRKLVQFFIKEKNALVSYELANRIVSVAIVSAKKVQSNDLSAQKCLKHTW